MVSNMFILIYFLIFLWLTGPIKADFDDDDEEVSYFLYSKINSPPVEISHPDLKPGLIANNSELIILIHGWTEHRGKEWYQEITDAYLIKGIQVIQIDWSKPASTHFLSAIFFVRQVGKQIADFLLLLAENAPIDLSGFHVICHSLGGSVSGYVGKHIRRATGGRLLGRITALDSVGPAHNFRAERYRLTDNDAEVVFGLHTDDNWYGFAFPFGTIDLYPNNGSHFQPGCYQPEDVLASFGTCSHHRSRVYFIEGLKSGKLLGLHCDNYASFIMGKCKGNKVVNFVDKISPTDRGKYYCITNSEPPFLVDPA